MRLKAKIHIQADNIGEVLSRGLEGAEKEAAYRAAYDDRFFFEMLDVASKTSSYDEAIRSPEILEYAAKAFGSLVLAGRINEGESFDDFLIESLAIATNPEQFTHNPL